MQRYSVSIDCTDWDKHQIEAEPDDDGEWVKFSDVQDLVTASLKVQESKDHWAKQYTEQNDGWNREHDLVIRLREALKPFANYACDTFCGCNNCHAKEIMTKTV